MADLAVELRDIGRRNLAALGFEVRFASHVDARWHHTAGTIEQRVSDLHDAYADPDVDVVMVAFGGYNANQLLAHLDYALIAAAQKPIVGYSDATALLAAIAHRAEAPAVHGPGFATFCDPNLFDYSAAGLRDVLDGGQVVFCPPAVVAGDEWYRTAGYGPRELHERGRWQILRAGEARAAIVGGNLETLGALAGTAYFPNCDGCLLFVEDAHGSSPGAFHRGLTQLAQIGVLDDVCGLLVGSVPPGCPLDDASLMHDILLDVLPADADYPVVYDVNCSHVDPMISIALGEPTTLSAIDAPSLTVSGLGRTTVGTTAASGRPQAS